MTTRDTRPDVPASGTAQQSLDVSTHVSGGSETPAAPVAPGAAPCWCNNGVQPTGHFIPSIWVSRKPSGYGAAGTGAYHCTMCHSEYVPGMSRQGGGSGADKCTCSVESIYGRSITARCVGIAGAEGGCGELVVNAYTDKMVGFWDLHLQTCKSPPVLPKMTPKAPRGSRTER